MPSEPAAVQGHEAGAAGKPAAADRASGNGPDQCDVIDFLAQPGTYGLRNGTVERVDTHISAVFLAGPRAYKLKRAVTFPYLDFSSLAKRRTACEREVQLNRRTAPTLYRGVIAVTREPDGRWALGGMGEPVEWLVEMVRFDQETLLDRLASAGTLNIASITKLARDVAAFHDRASPRREHGGAAAMRSVLDGNLGEMPSDPTGTLDPGASRALHVESMAAVARDDCLLDARRFAGLVRQCHGDLHLHNAFLQDGDPVLFDAIEFNDDFACIDVMYDFAFLLMDLHYRRLSPHANAALNAYMEQRADLNGLRLLPLFLSCRAAIRAKVSLAEATVQADSGVQDFLQREAEHYLRLARMFLQPAPPALIAIGGLSGSGKSTLASQLAPSVGAAPGAFVVRTDVIRKQLFGVEPSHRLPDRAYEPDVTARVYGRALHLAEACITAGHSVIVDAVFGDPRHRRAIARVATDAGVRFIGLWIDVPFAEAEQRLQARVADVSDATPRILRAQMRKPVGRIDWMRIDGCRILRETPMTLADVAALASRASSHARSTQ